jgi:KipI family sensor histidine kinase inhibitor
MKIRVLGEHAFLIEVAGDLLPDLVRKLNLDPFWTQIVPAETTMLAGFDPGKVAEARRRLRALQLQHSIQVAGRTVEIPVVYGGEFGPDLDFVANIWNVSPAEAVDLHVTASHRVLFLGFLPGFPYIESNLPDVPRLATPRPTQSAGSVAVAGSRTGIYPEASPGGWRIIGRTPVRIFDPAIDPPALLLPYDRISFVSISPDEWNGVHRIAVRI